MAAVSKPDRRADSPPLDPSTCPDCHAIVGAAVLRTDTAVHYRCTRCSRMWSIQKPIRAAREYSPDTDPQAGPKERSAGRFPLIRCSHPFLRPSLGRWPKGYSR